MDQQHVGVDLGLGGGGPMDQQQGGGGGGAGELATVPGVFSGQGFGAMLRGGYVCQASFIYPKGPRCCPRRGAFLFRGLRYRAYYARPAPIIDKEGGFHTW